MINRRINTHTLFISLRGAIGLHAKSNGDITEDRPFCHLKSWNKYVINVIK